MNIQHLVGMSNQIGTFFETMPDRQQALADIANHLKRNWTPAMRKQLLDHVEQCERTELIGIVEEALCLHKETLR